MASTKKSELTFTSAREIDRPKKLRLDGRFFGVDRKQRHGDAEYDLRIAGEFEHPLPPSEDVVAALAELDAAVAGGHAAIQRGRMLDTQAEGARREAIRAVRESVVAGSNVEAVETFDLQAAILASEGEVAGYVELANAARAKTLDAATAAKQPWIDYALSIAPMAHKDALEAVRATSRAIAAASSARTIATTNGTRFKAHADLEKITALAERLALEIEAATTTFEVDTTPKIQCHPSVASRRALTRNTAASSRYDDHSAWIYFVEQGEQWKVTKFTLGWPEPPSHFDRGVISNARSSYISWEDQQDIVATASAMTGGTSTPPVAAPTVEPATSARTSTAASTPEAALEALEGKSAAMSTTEGLTTGAERVDDVRPASTPQEAYELLERPSH